MESGQLPEPELPEPPDFPSSPVRASLSKRSSATIEVFISNSPFYFAGFSISNRPFTSEEVSIVSFHLPALAPSTESFLNLVCSLITGFSPVRYTDVMSSPCQRVDWASSRKLILWVTLELRNMGLFGDVLMDIAYVVSTFGGPCVVSLKEKYIGILSRMNMIMVGIDYLFVSLLEQSLFPIFPHVWSELDEQALLVLQGSSSQRMLSAYGACSLVVFSFNGV
ncbi:hypothetical protein DY000_02062920 [Brassica cretica]|uniref:Uncharacterized protein n=1 Tax=Brassica cretica TaxID=69181 RepID=A0ABQ7AYT2_BRACR|nr:hypothetical protein DY000_02062920 [Brassica cretica]